MVVKIMENEYSKLDNNNYPNVSWEGEEKITREKEVF